MPGRQQLLEQALGLGHDRGRRVTTRVLQRGAPHAPAQFVVADEVQQRAGQRVPVSDGNQPAVLAGSDDLAGSVRAVGAHDRQPAAHRLDDRHAEGLEVGRRRPDRALDPLRFHRGHGAHEEDVVVQPEPVDEPTQPFPFLTPAVHA